MKYYDRAGNLIPFAEWLGLMRSGFIEADDRVNDVSVTTAFLGADPDYREPPMLFETVVLGRKTDMEIEQYATEAEALAGHQAWVARVS